MNTTRDELFWSKVAILGDDDCWIYTGFKARGYGRFWNGERDVNAHRYSYELEKGPIPNGLLVRHTCDNPPCCNPRHLLTGTVADNSRDMVIRNRARCGETNPVTKLTNQDIVAIRSKYTAYDKERSQRAIGREYGISSTTVRNIVIRKTWKHVA